MYNDMMICIPSYKRKNPRILSFIQKNPQIQFFFCVRKDEYENGFYNEPQFTLNNISFMLLENVHCIGETREQIMQNCIKLQKKYCFMIDDTQFDFKYDDYSFDEILKYCLERLQNNKYADKAFSFIFSRKHSNELYFGSQFCQAYILNLDIIKEYDLHFKPMNEVGIEDLTFYCEAAQKGLIALCDGRIVRVGEIPSVKKEGGCHVGNEHREEIDVQNERHAKFIAYYEKMHYDKRFIQKVNSILFPGSWYYKFDTLRVRKMLIK